MHVSFRIHKIVVDNLNLMVYYNDIAQMVKRNRIEKVK
nr:MAG TPA: hypothetical protein [Caudoviricetes sp.]